jgi:hypothetical protein
MKWAGHAAYMEQMEIYKIRDHSGDLDVDGKMILEWILGK